MATREPDVKRRRLLDAALGEFSRRGLAGTPVDLIARRAACSPGLIYRYFGDKEGLFDAVLADISQTTVSMLPIDTADLTEYAACLHDASEARPDVNRFLSWYELEHADAPGSRTDPVALTRDKVDEIARAQEAGHIRDDVAPEQIVLVVQTLGRMWATAAAPLRAVSDPHDDAVMRRDVVKTAVADYLAGG